MTSREIISALKADGWVHVSTRGSHWQFVHPEKPGRVTVVHPRKDYPMGTLRAIELQAGVKLR